MEKIIKPKAGKPLARLTKKKKEKEKREKTQINERPSLLIPQALKE